MEANGGNQIVPKTFRTKSEHGHDFSKGAWQGARDSRYCEDWRAARAHQMGRLHLPVALKGKPILANLVGIESDARNGIPSNRH